MAFVIWAVCGAIMGIGLAVTTEKNTLIAHAIGGPTVAALVSMIYFRKYNYTTPLQTAAFFVGFMGTWIPFVLIFLATYLMGLHELSSGKAHHQVTQSTELNQEHPKNRIIYIESLK